MRLRINLPHHLRYRAVRSDHERRALDAHVLAAGKAPLTPDAVPLRVAVVGEVGVDADPLGEVPPLSDAHLDERVVQAVVCASVLVDGTDELVGEVVVIDLRSTFVCLGTLVKVEADMLRLKNADLHDLRDSDTSQRATSGTWFQTCPVG